MGGCKAIILKKNDNVATVLTDVSSGDIVEIIGSRKGIIIASQPIPYGHKISLIKVGAGKNILKYGEVIGRAIKLIKPGEHVHIHNVESVRGRGDL